MSDVVQNIGKYLDYKGFSKREVELKLSLSNGLISRAIKNNTDIGSDIVANFLNNYPDISPEWLLTGNGSMLRTEQKNSIVPDTNVGNNTPNPVILSGSEGSNQPHKTYFKQEKQQYLPLLPIEAMAGYGKGETQILELDTDKFLVPTFAGAEFLIQVKGSSMYPKYNSGDIVACKKLSIIDLFFQWNKVYVLDTEQGALIKRVKQGKDDNHVLIVSDNTNYDPFELHRSKIHAIAIVIGVIRLE